jgi:hypothetical protein
VASTAIPGRFGWAYCGEMKSYEVQPDGTLWERVQPLGPDASGPPGSWQRVGKRSDWVGFWGADGTALALTADGTLWTWGIDQGRERTRDLLTQLKILQQQVLRLGGPAARAGFMGGMPTYRKQPRPLMRLVFTNTVSPAKARGAGKR